MKSDKNALILIAGYKGMVGSSICEVLRSSGYTNLLLADREEIDFRNQDDVERFFYMERPEYVFLAAAKVGGILANSTYQAEFIYDNSAIALNVINASYKFGVKKLLNLGSSCIYPKDAPQPLKEEYLLTGELESTNEPYAIAKILAIKLCRYYNEQYGTNFFSVMPTNLYGTKDNFNLETSHVMPALIRKILLAKALMENDFDFILKDVKKHKIGFGYDEQIKKNDKDSLKVVLEKIGINGEYIRVWGSGNVRREFLKAGDMAEASVFLMENFSANDIGEFINIGTGEDVTIIDLAFLIKEIAGYQGDIKFESGMPEGTKRKLLDVSRINSLGWKSSTGIVDGIKEVIEFYKTSL